MSNSITLRGMAWDHPRARNPLLAVSAAWSGASGVDVHWDARPLKDFEDQPLEELASRYDLVLVDYPFMGVAATSGLIVPVDDWVDAGYLADQAEHSVGPSYRSYTWAGRQWALAIDAACQVSAVREDLWHGADLRELPGTWTDVQAIAGDRRHAPSRVAMPLNPNHAYCAFLSVGLSHAGREFWPRGGQLDTVAARESLQFLRRLAADLHPASRTDDPIGISDRMAATDEILHVPLMFGYSSYARAGFRPHRLGFGNAPRVATGAPGSVLGGVGLALSARSAHRDLAADLARTVGSATIQSGLYAEAGGQPGHGAAWDSAAVNRMTGDFFRATRATMNHAFLRPRVPGHRRFQPGAGELIHRCIWSGDPAPARCATQINSLLDELLPDWGNQDRGS